VEPKPIASMACQRCSGVHSGLDVWRHDRHEPELAPILIGGTRAQTNNRSRSFLAIAPLVLLSMSTSPASASQTTRGQNQVPMAVRAIWSKKSISHINVTLFDNVTTSIYTVSRSLGSIRGVEVNEPRAEVTPVGRSPSA
jgi:hypothetical protein